MRGGRVDVKRLKPAVLFLTKYDAAGASTRYRTLQYLPWLARAGIDATVLPLFDATYIARLYQGRRSLKEVLYAFTRRLRALGNVDSFDLVVVEYEVLPYAPAWPEAFMRLLNVPYIVDYDDALFHQYDLHRFGVVRKVLGGKVAAVMRGSACVIAGNAYLAEYARKAGAERVEIVPTVVDLERYTMRTPAMRSAMRVGWVGSPSTAKYLRVVEPALAAVCSDGRADVSIIGAGKPVFEQAWETSSSWSEATEVATICGFDVGIMPLPDEPWAWGKCGFKLIQYMACGLPVVASPVGVNQEIVDSDCGWLARDMPEWVEALEILKLDPERGIRMGRAGRAKVEAKYCLQVTAPRWVDLIRTSLG